MMRRVSAGCAPGWDGYGLAGKRDGGRNELRKLPKQFPMTHMKACARGIIRKLSQKQPKTEAEGVRALVWTHAVIRWGSTTTIEMKVQIDVDKDIGLLFLKLERFSWRGKGRTEETSFKRLQRKRDIRVVRFFYTKIRMSKILKIFCHSVYIIYSSRTLSSTQATSCSQFPI